MTSTLSPEAVDLVQRGRQSLIAAGPEGHTGQCYWSDDGTKRCGWGHIIGATRPGHDLEDGSVVGELRFDSPIGREIDRAYEDIHGHTVDWSSEQGWEHAIAGFDALLIDTDPDWEPSQVQGSQFEGNEELLMGAYS